MLKKSIAIFLLFALVLTLGAFAASGEASGEGSGEASGEAAVQAMLVIDGCAIAHDLTAVPEDEIENESDYIWSVSDGGGITYTDEDGVVWGIYRAGQAGVFEIVVSCEDDPSPWNVDEQLWVGGSRIVELCVQDGRLTHILTDELVAGAEYDVTLRAYEEDLFADPDFPSDAVIVSATGYSVYTKKPDSPQDAVIMATMYWDETNDTLYAIRFIQPMLPFDDNGTAMGWACVTDEALLDTLGGSDALVAVADGVSYAKYLRIGGIVWTGAVSSHPAAALAVDYSAAINGEQTTLNDYVRTDEGAAWYVNASREAVYVLTAPEGDAAAEWAVPYKETNGHGVYFWSSAITFPGNMQAIKDFVAENGFDYDYYADGGITKGDSGYWQTADAVSGATLDEAPSYLDLLKTLYNEIQSGNYEVESDPTASADPSGEAGK